MHTIRLNIARCSTLVTLFFCFILRSQGHDVDVHYQISQSAFRLSDSLKTFLTDSLGSDSSPFYSGPKLNIITDPLLGTTVSLTPMECVALGSYSEDGSVNVGAGGSTINTANGALTYLDHFYSINFATSPRSVIPLTDFTEANPSGLVTPHIVDAFTWATSTSVTHPVTGQPNYYNWPAARDFEFQSLTAPSKAERDNYLGAMLLSLGHVMHLNQDMSSPDHVRNDEHADISKKAFEPFGNEQFSHHSSWFTLPPNATLGYANWKQAGFHTLKDFWDRNLYTGNLGALRTVLNADASGSTKLGLAEFSNGNFLGEDASYAEGVIANYDTVLHYFPFPRRADMQVILDTKTYGSAANYQRAYLRKVGDGVPVQHHSTMNYVTTMIYYDAGMISLNSATRPVIKDDAVLNDYHSILLPKAVEYSTGILDYFFRGIIDPCITISLDDDSEWVLNVQNNSGETWSGGAFTVLEEQSDGTRTQVLQSTLDNPLVDGESMQLVLSDAPPSGTKALIIVYKGTIGLTDGNPSDLVDAGSAIATTTMNLGSGPDWTQINWDTVVFYGYQASGSAVGPTVQFSLAGGPDETYDNTYADIHGTLNYTGGPAICKINVHLDDISVVHSPDFAMSILQDGNQVFTVRESDLVLGDNQFTFPISCGDNSTIEILGSHGLMAEAGQGYSVTGFPPANITASFTLSH